MKLSRGPVEMATELWGWEARGAPMAEARPHPANVPGDFYVEDGCCMTCEVPLRWAPDLFAWCFDSEGSPHCFVKKQPETSDEEDRMFEAVRHAEAGCIRYCGRNRAIQQRLVEAGEGPICVDLSPELQQRSDEVLATRKPQGHRFWGTVLDLLMRIRRGNRA
jgi:hypothetical protein